MTLHIIKIHIMTIVLLNINIHPKIIFFNNIMSFFSYYNKNNGI